MIRDTARACIESGMPEAHAAAFQEVANRTSNIIASRSVGKWATQLLMESHASKGFHVKAKSCNWGPMAGFVCADPRFSKKGTESSAVAKQYEDVTKALTKDGAQTSPIKISRLRVNNLLGTLNCIKVTSDTHNEMTVVGNAKGSREFKFILRNEGEVNIYKEPLYSVYYHPSESPYGFVNVSNLISIFNRSSEKSTPQHLRPVMAMVNPHSEVRASNYRSAVTGDYDLWGIFPPNSDFDDGQGHQFDVRPVSSEDLLKGRLANEDQHLGNITRRGRQIKAMLNDAIKGRGYRGGNLIHHSDELGRPFVDEVELEFIAFFPHQNGKARFIKSLVDYKIFVSQAHANGYKVTTNPGWQGQLSYHFPAVFNM